VGAKGASAEQIAAGLASILLATDWRRLSISSLVAVAEELTRALPDMSFQPRNDGAAHWTCSLPVGQGVVCTISQIDSEPWVTATSMLTTLMLVAMGRGIQERVIGVSDPPRDEASISIASWSELSSHVKAEYLPEPDSMEAGFSIARSADLSLESQPPVVLVLR